MLSEGPGTHRHTGTHTCTHRYRHTCARTDVYTDTQVHVHAHTDVYTDRYTRVCTQTCTQTQVDMCTHMHTPMHAQKHVHCGAGPMSHDRSWGPAPPGSGKGCGWEWVLLLSWGRIAWPAPSTNVLEGNSPEAGLGSRRHRSLQGSTGGVREP